MIVTVLPMRNKQQMMMDIRIEEYKPWLLCRAIQDAMN